MRARGLLVPAVGLVLLLGACGDSGGGSAANEHPVVPGARQIAVESKSFSFSPSTITIAKDEDVTIKLSSDDSTHDFKVDGVGTIVTVNGGQTKSGGLKITKAGNYTFYCTIPGHRAAGMEGKLVVQ